MSFGDINRINTNLQALNARYALNKINQKIAKNEQQLATGKSINTAADNAAGFSIASQLTAKIGGLNQASKNVGTAKSMLNVAESGMNSINDILTKIKAKAVQGASDTVGATQRGYIKTQINNMMDQINNVVSQTKFQGKTLLSGNFAKSSGTLTFQVGQGNASSDTYKVNITNLHAKSGGLGISQMSGSAQSDFTGVLSSVSGAINTLGQAFNQIGIDQNSLSIRQDSLQQAMTSNKSARSSIQDANYAKLESQKIKLQIQQQTATSAFTQANSSQQAVLRFLK